MFFHKIKYACFFIFFISSYAFGQKSFEGKVVTDISYTNTPENLKDLLKNDQMVWYYKNNKVRLEMNEKSDKATHSVASTSVIINDYEKGDQLELLEILSLDNKTARLSNITKTDSPELKIEKQENYKTILGHKCQKVIITSMVNDVESKTIGYADFDFKINATLDLSGTPKYYPLFFESETTVPQMGTIINKIISISEEPFEDKLFSLNYPEGYTLTDNRTSANNKVVESNDGNEYGTFNKYTISELEAKLDVALTKEDFGTAEKIRPIIEKKKKNSTDYSSMTITKLQDMLKLAVTEENFATAVQLKEEIKKRKIK